MPPRTFAFGRVHLCGGCGTKLEYLKICAACGIRSYCSKECQVKDWAFHKQYCVDKNFTSETTKLNKGYDYKYNDIFMTLALSRIRFPEMAPLLQTEERRRKLFLPVSQRYFFHVWLRRVENPPPGRWNRVMFESADLDEIDRLPAEVAKKVRQRVASEERFPCFCLGYTINDPVDKARNIARVTTITHPFDWPDCKAGFGPRIMEEQLLKLINHRQELFATLGCQRAQEDKVKVLIGRKIKEDMDMSKCKGKKGKGKKSKGKY